MIFYIPLMLLCLLWGFPLWAMDKETLLIALSEVYDFPITEEAKWTPQEIAAYQSKYKNPKEGFSRLRIEGDIVILRNFDPLSKTGIFETRYHLKRKASSSSHQTFLQDG